MSEIIVEYFEGCPVEFRSGDGWINLTALCRAFGKRANDFIGLVATQALLVALAEDLGKLPSALVVEIEGRNGGTWIHPDLGVEVAGWVDIKFKLWFQRIVKSIIDGKKILVDAAPPLPPPSTPVLLPASTLAS